MGICISFYITRVLIFIITIPCVFRAVISIQWQGIQYKTLHVNYILQYKTVLPTPKYATLRVPHVHKTKH